MPQSTADGGQGQTLQTSGQPEHPGSAAGKTGGGRGRGARLPLRSAGPAGGRQRAGADPGILLGKGDKGRYRGINRGRKLNRKGIPGYRERAVSGNVHNAAESLTAGLRRRHGGRPESVSGGPDSRSAPARSGPGLWRPPRSSEGRFRSVRPRTFPACAPRQGHR